MAVQVEKRRWETKGLDCWARFKQGTVETYGDVGTAEERNELVSLMEAPPSAAIGKTRIILGDPYGAQVAGRAGKEVASRYCAAAEAKGWDHDMCAYVRSQLGSMYLDEHAFGGNLPRPDFGWRIHCTCDDHIQAIVPMAEHYGVPLIIAGAETAYEWDSEQTKQNKIEYAVAQTLESIEQLEKVTGREFDDEGFIKSVYDNSLARSIGSQILIMNQNIPAPLDEKTMHSLFTAAVPEEEKVELMTILRDEVEDRIKNQIAAVGTERYRVATYGIPPWYALNYLRYMEQYGVVSIGSRYMQSFAGGTVTTDTGIEIPVPSLQDCGIILRTREDAVRATTGRRLEKGLQTRRRFTGHWGKESELRLVSQWHCNGMVIHLNKGCRGITVGAPQVRLALLENNIPVLTFEGSHADPRDWDEARVFARIDTFMESQELERLV